MATLRQERDLRDRVLSIDQTQQELIIPQLQTIAKDVKEVKGKDYLTKAEADSKYVSQEQWKPVKLVFQFVLGILSIVVGAACVAFLDFILNGGLKP